MRFHHKVKAVSMEHLNMLEMKASFYKLFYVAVIILKCDVSTERHNKDVKCQILDFLS